MCVEFEYSIHKTQVERERERYSQFVTIVINVMIMMINVMKRFNAVSDQLLNSCVNFYLVTGE